MTSSARLVAAPTLALVLALGLAGCGDDSPSTPAVSSTPTAPASTPSASESSAPASPPAPVGPSLELVVDGDSVEPVGRKIEAAVGDTLVIRVTSDRAGELHVHSSPEQELGFEPGTTELEVDLTQPGQVDVEEHESDTLIARVLVQ